MAADYRTLTPTECRVLDAMRRSGLELDPLRRPTTAEILSKALDMNEEHVRKVVHDIQSIPGTSGVDDEYIISSSYFAPGQERGSGRPPASYHVNREHTATLPETALITLELLKFPQELPERVNYTAFVRHMVNRHGLDRDLVKHRIEKQIEAHYIDGSFRSQGHVAPTFRITCEIGYLELVASLKKPAASATESGEAQRSLGLGKDQQG